MRLGLLDDRVERRGVDDRQLAEHLAIQLDPRRHQCGDELAIADAALPEGGVQAGDPQAAEVTLLLPAVAVGVDAGLARELYGGAVALAGAAEEALGAIEYALSLAGVDGAAFGAGHGEGPFG